MAIAVKELADPSISKYLQELKASAFILSFGWVPSNLGLTEDKSCEVRKRFDKLL